MPRRGCGLDFLCVTPFTGDRGYLGNPRTMGLEKGKGHRG